MAKQQPKQRQQQHEQAQPARRGRGRPPADKPKTVQVGFRVDADVAAAVEAMRERMGVVSFSLSDTVREMTLRTLKAEGLLK